MAAKKTGMIEGAHPTAPGGMSQPALKVELVEKHGYKMNDLRNVKWPVLIDMVCEERLAREKEAGVRGPAHEEYETEVVDGTDDLDSDLDSMLAEMEQAAGIPGIDPMDADTNGLGVVDDDLWDDLDSDDDEDADDSEFLLEPVETEPEPEPEPLCGCGEPESAHMERSGHAFTDASYYEDEDAQITLVSGDTEPALGMDLDMSAAADPEAMLAEMLDAHATAEAAKPRLFIGMPTTRDYLFDGHAGAGPSGAERWMNCTASLGAARAFLETLTFNQQVAYADANTAARQGTTAHAVGEVRVRERLGEVDSSEVEATLMELAINPGTASEAYDDEMDEYVTEYVDLAQTYINEGREVRVESRVEAVIPLTQSGLTEDDLYIIRGSADLVALPIPAKRVLTVGDLKYGNGIDVDVNANPQIRIYALGVLGELADPETGVLPELDQIEYVICQPRLGGIKVWSESVEELLAWRDEALAPALTAALGGPKYGAKFAPSEGACQWCPVRGSCPALAEQRVEQAKDLFDTITEAEFNGEEFPETASLSDERLGALLAQVTALVALKDDLKDEAQRRLHRGATVPGYRLVNYQPPRKWKDSAATDPTLAKLPIWKPPTILTPKQAEAVLGEQASKIAKHIEAFDKRPVISTGPSDKRSDWTGVPPEAMFSIEGGDESTEDDKAGATSSTEAPAQPRKTESVERQVEDMFDLLDDDD